MVWAMSSSQRDRLGEAALGDEGRDRPARADRLLLAAERLVEPAEERAAEAGGERRARRIHDLADPLQPDPVEGRDCLRVEAERGEREGREHRRRLLDCDDRAGREPRRCRGGAGRAGDRGAGGEALRREAGEEVGDHRVFAAEEMCAAGHVEHQAVVIERDERRVALGPVGDRGKERGVGGRVLVDRVKRRDHGAGIGERLAGLEAEAHCCLIEGDEAERTLDLGDDDEGRVPYRSFPRKREPGLFRAVPVTIWIPACAGMSG